MNAPAPRYFYAQRTLGFATSSRECASADHAIAAADRAGDDMTQAETPSLAAAVAFSLSPAGEVEILAACTLGEVDTAAEVQALVSFARGGK